MSKLAKVSFYDLADILARYHAERQTIQYRAATQSASSVRAARNLARGV